MWGMGKLDTVELRGSMLQVKRPNWGERWMWGWGQWKREEEDVNVEKGDVKGGCEYVGFLEAGKRKHKFWARWKPRWGRKTKV